jgi:thioesterase domain-containing protein
VLFQAKQKSLRGSEDPQQAWSRWAKGGLEIREIAGDHGSIIRSPLVQLLARELATYLGAARHELGSTSPKAYVQ